MFRDWHQLITEQSPERLAGLALWYPDQDHEPVLVLPFSDLVISRPKPSEVSVEVVLPDEVVLHLNLLSRSAGHLAEALLVPLPMGSCLDLVKRPLSVRMGAYLSVSGRKTALNSGVRRACYLLVESETGEPLLPGPAMRLATTPPPPGRWRSPEGETFPLIRHEGLELLLPVADGSPTLLAQRLRVAIPELAKTARHDARELRLATT